MLKIHQKAQTFSREKKTLKKKIRSREREADTPTGRQLAPYDCVRGIGDKGDMKGNFGCKGSRQMP